MEIEENVEIKIPRHLRTLALYHNLMEIQLGEYHSVDGNIIPIIMFSSRKKPNWEHTIFNMYVRGGYFVIPGKIRQLKYLKIDGDMNKISGYVIVERTDEEIDGVPIFKVVTDKEPEAMLLAIRFKGYDSCEKIKINKVINALSYKFGCTYNGFLYKIYGGLIVPFEKHKKIIIDYDENQNRKRWVFEWDGEKLKDRNESYLISKIREISNFFRI